MQHVENGYDLSLVGDLPEGGPNKIPLTDAKYVVLDILPSVPRVLSLGISCATQCGFDVDMLQRGAKVVGVDPSIPSIFTSWKLAGKFSNYIPLFGIVSDEHGLVNIRYERYEGSENEGWDDAWEMGAHHSHQAFSQSALKNKKTYREVMSTTVDSLEKLYGGFDILKMNIEGYEYSVLNSLKSSRIAQIIVSFHHDCCEDFSIEDTLACIDKLEKLGYEAIDLHEVDPERIDHSQEEYLFINPSSSKKVLL